MTGWGMSVGGLRFGLVQVLMNSRRYNWYTCGHEFAHVCISSRRYYEFSQAFISTREYSWIRAVSEYVCAGIHEFAQMLMSSRRYQPSRPMYVCIITHHNKYYTCIHIYTRILTTHGAALLNKWIFMHTHRHPHTHTPTHPHTIYIYICMYNILHMVQPSSTHKYVCLYAYMYVCMYKHIYMYVYTYIPMYICTNIYICMYVYI